jgi:putative N6-adenine-specific DNA methylase
LKIAGWKGQCDFFDPMCGSGTMAIEAALIARKIPPGMFRKSFAFECWKDFDEDLFDSIYNADYEKAFEHQIYASDISSVNVKIATENAKNAGLKKDIQFSVSDFSSIMPEKKGGFIIINPPVAQRGNEHSSETLFTMIGDTLKKNFIGFNVWIFSNSDDCFRNIGLRFTDRYELVNGTLDCELRSFELYDGSRKDVRNDSERRSDSRDENRNSERRNFSGERRDGQSGRFSSDDKSKSQGKRFSSDETRASQGRRFSSGDNREDKGRRFQSSDSRDGQAKKFSSEDRREGQGSRFSSGEKRDDKRFPPSDSRIGQRRFSPEERKERQERRSSTEDNKDKSAEKTEMQSKRIPSVEKRAEQERRFITSESKENPKRKFTPGAKTDDNTGSSSEEKRAKRPRRIN